MASLKLVRGPGRQPCMVVRTHQRGRQLGQHALLARSLEAA